MGGLGSNIIAILPSIRIASYHHTIIPSYLVVSHSVYLLLTVMSSILVLSLSSSIAGVGSSWVRKPATG